MRTLTHARLFFAVPCLSAVLKAFSAHTSGGAHVAVIDAAQSVAAVTSAIVQHVHAPRNAQIVPTASAKK